MCFGRGYVVQSTQNDDGTWTQTNKTCSTCSETA